MGWRSTSCWATSLILDFSTTSRMTALTMTGRPPSRRLAHGVRQPFATLQHSPPGNAPPTGTFRECPSDRGAGAGPLLASVWARVVEEPTANCDGSPKRRPEEGPPPRSCLPPLRLLFSPATVSRLGFG